MSYATPDEVRAAVTRDLNRTANSTASMTDDQIQSAIDNAQSQIDSKLRRLYELPFSEPVPAMVKTITIDIAGYLATMNYRQEKTVPEVDPIVRRYNRAHDLLCFLAKGFYSLEAPDGSILSRTNGFGRPIGPSFRRSRLFPAAEFGLGPARGVLWID